MCAKNCIESVLKEGNVKCERFTGEKIVTMTLLRFSMFTLNALLGGANN